MLKRVITIELDYDPMEDVSPENFREYSVTDVLELGTVMYDEIEGDEPEIV